MIRLSRLIMQWALLPPIHLHFHSRGGPGFLQRWIDARRRRDQAPPPPSQKPNNFDPTRKVSNYEARCLAASNAFKERKPL